MKKLWPWWLFYTTGVGVVTYITGKSWMHTHPSGSHLVVHVMLGITTFVLLVVTVYYIVKEEFHRGKSSQ